MLAIAKLALYAWVPLVLLIFAVMTPRRAVIFAYIGGWLFLPMLSIKLNGIPDLTKITAASFGVLLGSFIFDWRTLLKFRPKWFDVPMLLWCLSPFVTSIKQNIGAYDGASNIVTQMGVWGIPYFIGRCYFNELEAYKELGVGIVIGALIYMPFAWLEMKTSPLLHKWLYGFAQHDLSQTKRWGGYRPMVFMQSGLALAMYMTVATAVGMWMWITGTVKKIGGIPMSGLMFVLFTTAILCKTMAAIAFLFMVLGALAWIWSLRSTPSLIAGLPILVMTAIPPTYIILRATETVDRDHVINVFEKFTSEERLKSLDVRLTAEDKVTEKALEPITFDTGKAHDPWWGWGRWDPENTRETPWRIYIRYDKMSIEGIPYTVVRDDAATDGLWIITLGEFGKVGVFLLTLTILVPPLILWRRIPLRFWHHPMVAPAAAMGLLLITHMIDNLLNGMVNPIFMLALGGLSAISPSIRPIYRRYGEKTAWAALNTLGVPQPRPVRRGFPVQPYGQHGPAVPAFQQPPQQPSYPGVAGFPLIPGLQVGPMAMPQRQRARPPQR